MYVFMGPVADGTMCQDGSIVATNDGACTIDGALSCAEDGQSFFLCDNGMSIKHTSSLIES